MLEWFLPKVILLVFVVALFGALLYFLFFQQNIMKETHEETAARNIALMIDLSLPGTETEYYTGIKNYVLSVSENQIEFNNITRRILSNVSDSVVIGNNPITIKNENGVVHVS